MRHEGEGVARRAAFHAREREARDREAAQGLAELPSDEAAGVKEVSAREVLESVAESGPNYVTLPAAERQKARRERLRVVEAARQAGQAIVDTGTHVEILGVQERWWPATIMGRQQDVDGRLVHEVEYDGYPGEQYWHVLDDEEWRVVTAPASDAADAAADAAGNAAPANGEESDSEESGDEAAPAALTRLGVQRSTLADVLEDLHDASGGGHARRRSISHCCRRTGRACRRPCGRCALLQYLQSDMPCARNSGGDGGGEGRAKSRASASVIIYRRVRDSSNVQAWNHECCCTGKPAQTAPEKNQFDHCAGQ